MRKLHLSTLLAALLAVTWSTMLRADFNAEQIANNFNTMNGGVGYRFTYKDQNLPSLQAIQGTASANLDAYLNSVASGSAPNAFFRTFCVNPLDTVVANQDYIGKLNIQADGTTKTARNNALTVGAAFLYKAFATTDVSTASPAYSIFNIPSNGNRDDLQKAIYYLMGLDNTVNPQTNVYLQFLAQQFPERSLDYWTSTYKSTERYDEIGDYFVFVVNVNQGTTIAQDFLYVASATWTQSAVPEPATFLLWTLGSVGAFGISHYRRRNEKA